MLEGFSLAGNVLAALEDSFFSAFLDLISNKLLAELMDFLAVSVVFLTTLDETVFFGDFLSDSERDDFLILA